MADGMTSISFEISCDCAEPLPLKVLRKLLAENRLPRFAAAWGCKTGDCFSVVDLLRR
jgi:hypothetical protein